MKRRRFIVERKIVERLRAGDSASRISRELRVRKQRCIRIRELAVEYGYLDAEAVLPPYPAPLFPPEPDGRALRSSGNELLLHAQRSWIEERLRAGWRAVSVWEGLSPPVSRSSFYRYLVKHNIEELGSKGRKVIPEIVHEPGEALQIDWGKIGDVVESGAKRALYAFVGTLGYSRLMFVRFVWSNGVEETLPALACIFEQAGGVPKKTTSDNPKCFTLRASKYEPLLNPAYERFASHYGTIVECLPPREPKKKGKVERAMPYVRRLWETHGEWQGIEEAQAWMDERLILANQRKHGTTNEQPIKRFEETERGALLPLPAHRYEREQYHCGIVREDGHIRFDGKYYSLDKRYIGCEVVILATSSVVSLFCEGRLIDSHPRVTDRAVSKSTKAHHLEPWLRALEDESFYRAKAKTLGPSVDEFVDRILKQGMGFVDFRCIWGIFDLAKDYPREVLNKAVQQALDIGQLRYLAIKRFLAPQITTKQAPTVGSAKFCRSAEEYQQQLFLIQGGKK